MKIDFEKEKGIEICATFHGSVEDYAMMWLHLTNNARENKHVFYQIRNNSGNDVFVLIADENDNKKAVIDYLKRLELEINWEKKCTVVCPWVEYDNDDEYEYEFARVSEY